jgi:hypothetical protein
MSTPIDKALGEGNCGRATERGKEAGAKPARLRTETAYKAGSPRRVCHATRSRSRSGGKVNAELAQGKFTFLSGEICPTYLGVGLARKPGPCMRKQLGVGQKSADVVVPDLTRH